LEEEFLIHHLPTFTRKTGEPLLKSSSRLKTLMNICGGGHPATVLCSVDTNVHMTLVQKLHEDPSDELLKLFLKRLKQFFPLDVVWALEVK